MAENLTQSQKQIPKKISMKKKNGKKNTERGGQMKPEENKKSPYKKEMIDVLDIEDCLVKTNRKGKND